GESAAVSVAVNVLDANDPACIGGGTGCGVFDLFSVVEDVNPSCNNIGQIEHNGSFKLHVQGGVAPYKFTVSSIDYFEEQFNDPYFDGLKAGVYTCTVTDALGNECTLTKTLLPESTLVGYASNMVDAVCYGSNTGKA